MIQLVNIYSCKIFSHDNQTLENDFCHIKHTLYRILISTFRDVYSDDGNKTCVPTTWQVVFGLEDVDEFSNYTLQLALAQAHVAELQVWTNNNLLYLRNS